MADNPYVNKVQYNGNTLIDLTSDTVTASSLLSGVTAHDASGAPITGDLEMQVYNKYVPLYTPTNTDDSYDVITKNAYNTITDATILDCGDLSKANFIELICYANFAVLGLSSGSSNGMDFTIKNSAGGSLSPGMTNTVAAGYSGDGTYHCEYKYVFARNALWPRMSGAYGYQGGSVVSYQWDLPMETINTTWHKLFTGEATFSQLSFSTANVSSSKVGHISDCGVLFRIYC